MPGTEPGFNACPADRAATAIGGRDLRLRPERFRDLHPDGRELISRWIERGVEKRGEEPFEAFIYAWIGLNGWASCVCGVDRDITLIQVMQLDARLTRNFAHLMEEDEFGKAALDFSALWPIFRVSDLPEPVRRNRPTKGGRPPVVRYYQATHPKAARSPDCHLNHAGDLDPDWGHTLEALYRVRCNLFHGQKSGAGKEDHAILTAAASVLVPVASSVLRLS